MFSRVLGRSPPPPAADSGRLVRRTDYEFLTSPQAREVLRQEDIAVIDYRTIQRVWSQIDDPR
ncbi:hypothetical protein ABTZ59_16020 [Streptomyces sp. NPDC094034]|uniref:hypothetical protein n=1 Tax=Streptomyces sp. NPDC094034 TaxID=3155309 RepID=UPI00331C0565